MLKKNIHRILLRTLTFFFLRSRYNKELINWSYSQYQLKIKIIVNFWFFKRCVDKTFSREMVEVQLCSNILQSCAFVKFSGLLPPIFDRYILNCRQPNTLSLRFIIIIHFKKKKKKKSQLSNAFYIVWRVICLIMYQNDKT